MSENEKTAGRISGGFGNVLAIVFVLTLLCFIVMVGLGVAIADPTDSQQTMLDNVSKGFFGGLGLLGGLLGGKLS